MDKTTLIEMAYLCASVMFILGIKRLSKPDTAPGGNRLAALGMLVAIVTAPLRPACATISASRLCCCTAGTTVAPRITC